MPPHQRMFNVPFTVIALIGLMAAIHLVRQLLPIDTDNWFVTVMAFIPARYSFADYPFAIPGGDIAAITSFVTHMFVHGDMTHLMFNAAWLLACGGAIALRIGSVRFLLFAITTGVAGALAFMFLNFGKPIPVVGASGAISGLMAGLLRFLFSAVDQGDVAALRYAPKSVRLTPLIAALQDTRVLAVTLIWLGLNALAAFGLGVAQDTGEIAWEAHMGGFLSGLLLFGCFDISQKKPLHPVH